MIFLYGSTKPNLKRYCTGIDMNIEVAWHTLLLARSWVRQGKTPDNGQGYGVDDFGKFSPLPSGDSRTRLLWDESIGWVCYSGASPSIQDFFDLYLPICNVSMHESFFWGHLGQGLDGYIATRSGDSHYVTGPENILHLHRMRALCDAVLVGAGTVLKDNPRLTTRQVEGENPVRVILDPQLRLPLHLNVFSDKRAETLIFCDETQVSEVFQKIEGISVVGVPMQKENFDLSSLIGVLHRHKLMTIFVEGGGKTVSSFLEANLLDRLQIAIAPLVLGEGIPGIGLPGRQSIKDCLRLPHRVFRMGSDILFDCDLRDPSSRAETIEREFCGIRRVF